MADTPFANINLDELGKAFGDAAKQAADAALRDLASLKLDAEQSGLVARATTRLANAQLGMRLASEAERPEWVQQSREAISVLADIHAEKHKDVQDAVIRNANNAVATVLGILMKVITVA